MTWTVKKDFHGVTAINQKQTGAIEFREKDDRKFAIVSAKYEAFKLTGADMYQLGYLLIALSGIEDADARSLLETDVNFVLQQRPSPLMSRVVELPKREDGCVDLSNGTIAQYIQKGEDNGN